MADLVLQAKNTISLDLQGDTLNLANDRSITLTTTNGNISTASAGTITTTRTGTGGNITFNAGGTGNINIAHALSLNAQSGGTVQLNATGGSVNASGGLTTTGALTVNAGGVAGTYTGGAGTLGSNAGLINATTSFSTLNITGAGATLLPGYVGAPGAATQTMANLVTVGGVAGPASDTYKFAGFKIGYVAPAETPAGLPAPLQQAVASLTQQAASGENDIVLVHPDKTNQDSLVNASADCLLSVEGVGCVLR